jgi:hypothetical protein
MSNFIATDIPRLLHRFCTPTLSAYMMLIKAFDQLTATLPGSDRWQLKPETSSNMRTKFE